MDIMQLKSGHLANSHVHARLVLSLVVPGNGAWEGLLHLFDLSRLQTIVKITKWCRLAFWGIVAHFMKSNGLKINAFETIVISQPQQYLRSET